MIYSLFPSVAFLVISIGSLQGANVLVNGNFDSFSLSSAPYNTAYNATTNPNGYSSSFADPNNAALFSRSYRQTVAGMGWQTTASDTQIELWQNGNRGIPSASGIQYAELNANFASTLFQDVQITEAGLVDYSLAHRGRNGSDTMNVTITYLGANNLIGGGDDVVLVNTNYADGNAAWGVYAVDNAFTSVQNGTYRFAFTAVSAAGGNNSTGNFLDNVAFGVNVVPEPSVALLSCAALIPFLRRRR